MKMFNHEVAPFAEFLFKMKLSPRQSRMRTRMIRLLSQRSEQIDGERLELARQFDLVDENDVQRESIDQGNFELFRAEVVAMLNEVYPIAQDDTHKDMLVAIKTAVLEYDEELSELDAVQYDRWCEIVEQINYE